MSTTPFIRVCQVIVGNANEAISLGDLRVNFEIKKSRITYPNLAKIQIWNLSDNTRNKIRNEFTKVLVNAGYRNNVSLVFTGDIKNVYHHVENPDIITEIYAGDGDAAWQDSSVNTSIAGTMSLKDTVKTIASTLLNIEIGQLNGLDNGKVNDKTICYSGPTHRALDNLAKTYGFEWSIQNGIFETVPSQGAVNTQAVATVVSSTTGMIGSPTVTEIGANVTTLFNAQMLPNRWILIQAAGSDVQLGDPYFRPANKPTIAQGFYIINTVTHQFDTRSNDALTTLECRAPGTT